MFGLRRSARLPSLEVLPLGLILSSLGRYSRTMKGHQSYKKPSRPRTNHPRPFRAVVHLTTKFQSITMLQPTEGRGYTFDLSANGCCIESDTGVQVGTYLSIQLELSPHDDASSVSIPVARVRWVCECRFGVKFMKQTQQDSQCLQKFVGDMASQGTV